jgi:hypothetical protein
MTQHRPSTDPHSPGGPMNWTEYEIERWANQPLPPVRKYVLVQVKGEPEIGMPPSVAVGYMRYAAGDENSPAFTTPGVDSHKKVFAWCDCLPDDFWAPLWPGTKRASPEALK